MKVLSVLESPKTSLLPPCISGVGTISSAISPFQIHSNLFEFDDGCYHYYFSSIWTIWVQRRLDHGCYYFTCIWITELDGGCDYYHYIMMVSYCPWFCLDCNLYQFISDQSLSQAGKGIVISDVVIVRILSLLTNQLYFISLTNQSPLSSSDWYIRWKHSLTVFVNRSIIDRSITTNIGWLIQIIHWSQRKILL